MPPRRRDLLSIAVIAAAAVAMATLTWGTWPDAIYDYGTHLYVPWQLARGRRLYVDLDYFYGPLSAYLNAGLFRLFGVGLWTLVWANLAVLAGVLAVVRHLAGTAAAGVVVGVFAFGQYVAIGNYNWACPYCHEVTHGVALGLAAVAAVAAHGRGGRRRWLAVAGVAVGLGLLTKPEVSAATVAAVAVGVALQSRAVSARGDRRSRLSPSAAADADPGPTRPGSVQHVRRALAVALPAAGVVAVAFAMLALHGGLPAAFAGVVGPWRWVVDRRVGGLAFYRQGMGTDDLSGNLAWMAVSLLGTVAVAAVAAATAVRRWRVPALVAAVAAGVAIGLHGSWAFAVARPWPVLVAGVAVVAVERAVRGPVVDQPTWAARATLAVFALGLLAKMALAARVSQYGFTLALPAAAVLTDAAVRWGPAALSARGLDGRWAAVVAFSFIALLVGIHVDVTASMVAKKHVREGTGRDQFWADDRGRSVDAAVAAVGGADTVLVAPQGLMVNYLARRPDPIAVLNLMPPELATTGEAAVLAELRRHPPAAVVVLGTDTADGGLLLTEGHHVYGRSIVTWIRAHYEPDPAARVPPGELGLFVLRRRR